MLLLGFSSIIIISVIIISISIFSIKKVSENTETIYNLPYAANDIMWEIRKEVISVEGMLYKGIATENEEQRKAAISSAETSAKSIVTNLKKLQELVTSQDKIDILNDIMTLMQQAKTVRIEVSDLITANQNREAIAKIDSDYSKIFDSIVNKVLELSEIVSSDAENFVADAKSSSSMVVFIMIGLLAIGVVIALVITVAITRVITVPITEIMSALKELSKGNLSIDILYESKNEFGVLAKTTKETGTFLKEVVGDLSYCIGHLANRNFGIKTSCEQSYIGDFKPVLLNFREMVSQLRVVLRQIDTASTQVASGSSQMAEGSQGLSEGVTEQASAVGELQASITTIVEQVQANVKEGEVTLNKAKEVEKEAAVSSNEMNQMTGAMKRISETSTQIGNIIAEIEDIATQTNLLSLNAAIEAARAGEAGKGFSVVAEQIRKLAEDSAKSAVNTRDLIETAIREVENGNEITEKTAQSLSQVIDGLKEISKSVEHTSELTRSQLQSMEEIERGIDQISGVVESNSAAAEESSAVSEELSAQAVSLSELAGSFELGD